MKEQAEATPLHHRPHDIWSSPAAHEDEPAPEPAAKPSEQEVGKKNPKNIVIEPESPRQ